MVRTQLPTRRRNETMTMDWHGQTVSVTFGYDDQGNLREIFADVAKQGTDLNALISDWCVIVSIAIQHGISPADLARSLTRVPEPMRGRDATVPASLIGTIMEAALEAGMLPISGGAT